MSEIRNPYSTPNPVMHPSGTMLLLRDGAGNEFAAKVLCWLSGGFVRIRKINEDRGFLSCDAQRFEIVRVLEGEV